MAHDSIMSICMSEHEDQLYTVNVNNQLQTVEFSFNPKKFLKNDEGPPRIQFLHSAFHSMAITGMDICLRKQLIVTTSHRYINIWNYATKTLEISH